MIQVGTTRIGAPEPARYFKGSLVVEGTGRARRNAQGAIEIEVIEGRHRTWSARQLLAAQNLPGQERIESAERGEGLS